MLHTRFFVYHNIMDELKEILKTIIEEEKCTPIYALFILTHRLQEG